MQPRAGADLNERRPVRATEPPSELREPELCPLPWRDAREVPRLGGKESRRNFRAPPRWLPREVNLSSRGGGGEHPDVRYRQCAHGKVERAGANECGRRGRGRSSRRRRGWGGRWERGWLGRRWSWPRREWLARGFFLRGGEHIDDRVHSDDDRCRACHRFARVAVYLPPCRLAARRHLDARFPAARLGRPCLHASFCPRPNRTGPHASLYVALYRVFGRAPQRGDPAHHEATGLTPRDGCPQHEEGEEGDEELRWPEPPHRRGRYHGLGALEASASAPPDPRRWSSAASIEPRP
jgi:hypothetical protein